jgi:hypothetical protein
MGREAICRCKWGAEEAECKVLLEGSELIVRLGLRRRVARTEMTDVAARGSKLLFNVGHDHVELHLGAEAAQRWAKAITSPLPTLASKLGVSPSTRLSVIGEIQSQELKAAVAEAKPARGREVDLILICVNSVLELNLALDQCFTAETCCGPLWIVYPKGASSEIRESDLRGILRSHGFIDTKVASVSAKLTALRFVSRPAR